MHTSHGRGRSLTSARRIVRLLPALVSVVCLSAATKPIVVPTAKPPAPAGTANSADRPVLDATDLKDAVPANSLTGLPSTAEQYRQLNDTITKQQPLVDSAQEKSEKLAAEARSLKEKLIATARRISSLESDTIRYEADIVRLTAEDKALSELFARDRVRVSRLLAMLERLQHDMPPAMVLKSDDALGAVRGAMLIGATVPDIYDRAAELVRRIDRLKKTRDSLVASKAEAARTTVALTTARGELDQLLERKQQEAQVAEGRYSDLAAELATAADQASDLKALLAKVAQIRGTSVSDSITVVAADPERSRGSLSKGALLTPVAGKLLAQVPGTHDPGLTFATPWGAQVIAPADSKVLFAGPYHKSGQVLILEMPVGYDLVLAGLGRIEVRPDDELLAGEPVGTMPKADGDGRLYFVMRQDGREISPAPWMELEMRKANKS